ncbi:MAG TPA: XRE family transcriptional regulator [Vicinamibacteria bacterium]
MKPGGENDPGLVSEAIARNVRLFRSARGWSLDQLAARSGVSKGMVVQIERGATNPSIATLCRVAGALGVSMPRLVEVAETPAVRLVRVEEAATLWRSRAGSTARLLVGLNDPDLVEMWDWRLAPGDSYQGEAHPGRSHELLHVLEGVLSLTVDQARHQAREGETLLFRADRPHVYANEGKAPLRFIMTWVESRPPSEAPPEAPPAAPRRSKLARSRR